MTAQKADAKNREKKLRHRSGFDDGIEIAGQIVAPGDQVRLEIPLAQMATQGSMGMPVEVIYGEEAGPVLLITGAVHGDELNGIEVVRQLLPLISPKLLRGVLVAVPVVNVPAFLTQSRYLPDRRDLNRSFPGSASGSLASRIAHTIMQELVSKADLVVDIHTAGQGRNNVPQVRVNSSNEQSRRLAKSFGAPVIIHSAERDGSLRMAAQNLGIPSIVYEAGEACKFDASAIDVGLLGVLGIMHALDMVSAADIHLKKTRKLTDAHAEIFAASKWVRAQRGGLFRCHVSPGDRVVKDQFLGFIADAFGDGMTTLRSPRTGLVVGLHTNPLVHQGDAVVHIAYDRARV